MIRRFARLAMWFAASFLWPAAAQSSGGLYVVTTIGGTTLGAYAGNGDGGRAMDARVFGESLARDSINGPIFQLRIWYCGGLLLT